MLNLEHSNALKRESTLQARLDKGLAECNVGSSFILELPEGTNVATIRAKISKTGKASHKRFVVNRIDEAKLEISRLSIIADEAPTDIEPHKTITYFASEKKYVKPKQDLWALIEDLYVNCPVGMSFAIQIVTSDVNEVDRLRALIKRRNFVFNRNVEVIKRPDDWYEIAHRGADAEMPEPYKVQPIDWTLENN